MKASPAQSWIQCSDVCSQFVCKRELDYCSLERNPGLLCLRTLLCCRGIPCIFIFDDVGFVNHDVSNTAKQWFHIFDHLCCGIGSGDHSHHRFEHSIDRTTMLTESPPTKSLKVETDHRGLRSNILFVDILSAVRYRAIFCRSTSGSVIGSYVDKYPTPRNL